MLKFSDGASGQILVYGQVDTSMGSLLVTATDVGIHEVSWMGLHSETDGPDLALIYGRENKNSGADNGGVKREAAKGWLNKAEEQLKEYFAGKSTDFELNLDVNGTLFQKQVWRALAEIPYGQTRSYKDIAVKIGRPKAVRAVGQANRRNPVAVIVPCHRVIGSGGQLVGYAGSQVHLKADLLHLEKDNVKVAKV